MLRLTGGILVLVILCSCVSSGSVAELLIRNVNIVDVEGKRVHGGQDLWITDSRIQLIAVHGSRKTRAQEIYDAKGAYAIAGLYDAHVHIDTPARLELMLPEIFGHKLSDAEIDDDLAAYMAYGVTGIVVLGGNDAVLAARERSRKAGRFLPRIVAASPILDGPQAGNPVHVKISGTTEAVAAVDSAAAKGYDLIKIYNDLDTVTRNAVIERASELGLPVVGHLPPGMSLQESIVPGFANVAHAEEITRSWDGEDRDYLARAVRLMSEYDVSLTPNLVAYREISGQISGIEKHLENKEWSLTPPLARVYSKPPFNGYIDDFGGDDIRERAINYFDRTAGGMDELTLMAHKSGVLVLAASDTGNPTMYPGQSLYREMQLLRAAGLDAYEAIAAATINIAKLLGEEHERGSIASGKLADLVIFDANPVEKESLERENIAAVVRAGELFTRDRIAKEVRRLGAAYNKRETRYHAAAMTGSESDRTGE